MFCLELVFFQGHFVMNLVWLLFLILDVLFKKKLDSMLFPINWIRILAKKTGSSRSFSEIEMRFIRGAFVAALINHKNEHRAVLLMWTMF